MFNFLKRVKNKDVQINLIDEDNKVFGVVSIPNQTFDLIEKAAGVLGQNPIDFIRQATITEADHVIASNQNHFCDNCGQRIHEVFHGSAGVYMFLDSLELIVGGGYGMYVDNDRYDSKVICKNCCELFCDALPGIAKELMS